MDKVKEVLKDNIPIIIVAVVVIAIAIGYKIYENKRDSEIYESGLQSNEIVKFQPKVYEENEYRVIDVADQDIAVFYYKDILDKMVNDRKSLYQMLTKDERKSYKDFQEFDKEIEKRFHVNFKYNTLEEYSVKEKGNFSRTFVLLDSDNYLYQVYEYGVWNFEVEFIGYK